MRTTRQLIVSILILAIAAPAGAQSQLPTIDPADLARTPARRLDLASAVATPQPQASSALHPVAKGAIIGAAVGGAFMGGLGLWYCTIGPHEVGECGAEQWIPAIALWTGVGAGVGALVGAVVGRR